MIKKLTLLLFITACQKEYNTEICDELAQMSYKGYPNQSREFKDNCKDIPLNYPPQKCHEALQGLMLGKKMAELKEVFGEKIDGCFTESDLKRFSR